MSTIAQHAATSYYITYLKEVTIWRLHNPGLPFKDAPPLQLQTQESSPIYPFITENKLTAQETIVLLLALAPHLQPNLLIETVAQAFPQGVDFPLFGGVKGKNHRGIIPTGETAQFIIGGTNIEKRLQVHQYFTEAHPFQKKQQLYLEAVPEGGPTMSGKILLYSETLQKLTLGYSLPPKLSSSFPAQKLETPLTWEDLVLSEKNRAQINELQAWLTHNHTLMHEWGMKNKLKPGYRAMIFGPPGTGKTLTVSLLGKYTQKPVYRIDLSTVISKYIGETEKHLSNLFDRAANKDWVLFFDEADAIFGKRTNVRDAHDKYANQEVSYLLQRVEAHPGLVILASNFRDNIDEAFTRRFQSIIEFKMPDHAERLTLWQNNIPQKLLLDKTIDLEQIARKYELSGSNIINIVQFCALQVLSTGDTELKMNVLIEGIKREYKKENKLY